MANINVDPRWQLTKCEATMRHFRCLYDLKDQPDFVVKTGYQGLHYSGSGQFGADHLSQLDAKVEQVAKELNAVKPEIWILDARTEKHGFRNGEPIVWKVVNDHLIDFNKTPEEILKEENALVSGIQKTTIVFDRKDEPALMGDAVIETEKDVVEKLKGFHYLRLPIAEHFKPTDDCVEELVKFVVTHPHAWIHAHCYVKARTTVILALIDMMHNAHQVSFDAILARQRALDGSDLTKISPEISLNHPGQRERDLEQLVLLQNFYVYCKEADPLKTGKMWKDWNSQSVKS